MAETALFWIKKGEKTRVPLKVFGFFYVLKLFFISLYNTFFYI